MGDAAGGRARYLVRRHRTDRAGRARVHPPLAVLTERTELAAHEYIHLWQYDVGGNPCMVGVRWISEGMAESFAYRSLVADGVIPQANLDVFTKRQLRTATQQATLQSLEVSWPAAANPFAVSYLAVDRLLATKGLLAIRDWCGRVGAGHAAGRLAARTEDGEPLRPRCGPLRHAP